MENSFDAVEGNKISEIIIRFAQPSEVDSCFSFDYIRNDENLQKKGREILKQKIDQKQIILAESPTKIIGYFRMNDIVFKPYLGYIVIDAAYRSKGLGKRMLDFLEGHLVEEGHNVLYSSSQADASRSQNWHRKMGFEECGIIAGFNDRTADDLPSVGMIGEVYFRKLLERPPKKAQD
ncbi:MAG: GNAT family N-acetyltransferase [Nitrososphaerales archaeon]